MKVTQKKIIRMYIATHHKLNIQQFNNENHMKFVHS
jgi:hypothetical protein